MSSSLGYEKVNTMNWTWLQRVCAVFEAACRVPKHCTAKEAVKALLGTEGGVML